MVIYLTLFCTWIFFVNTHSTVFVMLINIKWLILNIGKCAHLFVSNIKGLIKMEINSDIHIKQPINVL